MDVWDPTAFKTLLRTTSQRLGQIQERKDARSQLTRREIATCLTKGQLAHARAKAAVEIQEDVMGDLLEELEMHVGVVGSRLAELGGAGSAAVDEEEQEKEGESGTRAGKRIRSITPVLVEAAASIIYAAPGTDSKDLNVVREVLMQRLGPTFTQVASASGSDHVSSRIMQLLSSPSPTAAKIDTYLVNIAQTYGVKWAPEPRREELIGVLSEILRVDGGSSPIVDLPRLREICSRGLPDDPPWVRPRTWRLLFGTLSNLKTTWAKESRKQRASYYDLVRRLLTPLAALPSPTTPLSPTDALLSRISDSLFRVSPDLFALLGNEPQSTPSRKCPLDPAASDGIPCASNMDKRLSLLKHGNDTSETPEIRIDLAAHSSDPPTPPSPPSSTLAARQQRQTTTLLPSKAHNAPPAHRTHLSALLRLLYIHSALNPAVQSPHIPWLLVPLYSALVGETDEEDAVHAEADTFWVFETLVGEIAEIEEEGGKIWTRKLSERIGLADGELATSLHANGLDPIHPHYSYWLAPLLGQTLPLPSLFLVWDVLFACPMRTRDANPKLEYLVDICTALLVRARAPLFRLGKTGQNAPSLWAQEHASLRPPSPLRPWELSDAFTQGIALLMAYPIDAAGGIDRILQMASDLAQKRIGAKDREKEKQRGNVGFGARITRQMWKGFTNQVTDEPEDEGVVEVVEEEEESEEDKMAGDETGEHDDGNETETPAAPTLTSRLANTWWRGITNQSSMEDEVPSPPSPQSPTLEERNAETSTPSSQASLWNYAGKLKDSDAIAAFSKVSSNWRAKALDAWGVRTARSTTPSPGLAAPAQLTPPSAVSEFAPRQSGWPGLNGRDASGPRRGSLPGTQRESEHVNLDPPRPAFFRSPRESFLPQPRRQHATAPPSPNIEPRSIRDSDAELNGSSSSFIHRAGASIASLATIQLSNSTPKNVPRPLMLSSRTNKSQQPSPFPASRSEGGTPEYRDGASEWGEVLLAAKNRHALRQESVSSTSSISPPESMHRSPYLNAQAQSAGPGPHSDHESDGSAAVAGRKVLLNRKAISPMALASRSPHLPWNATSPGTGSRGSGHPLSNGSVTAEDMEAASATSDRGWRHFDAEEHPSAVGIASTVMTGTGMSTTGFDSPTTIASPPIPRTPLMPPVSGIVRIANGGHVATSSISTLSETSEMHVAASHEPPPRIVRKRTPPLPGTPNREPQPSSSSPGSGESEMELERTPSGKAAPAVVKLRSKRYVPRAGHLRVRTGGLQSGTTSCVDHQRTPSPGQPQQRRSLVVPEWAGEGDLAVTPKVESHSGVIREDEGAGEGVGAVMSRPAFVRKPSKEARLRKVSSAGMRDGRRVRDSSGAEEGDDEGYGDLLSAYESEEGSRE